MSSKPRSSSLPLGAGASAPAAAPSDAEPTPRAPWQHWAVIATFSTHLLRRACVPGSVDETENWQATGGSYTGTSRSLLYLYICIYV